MTIAGIFGPEASDRFAEFDVQPLTPRDFTVEIIASAPTFVLITGDAPLSPSWEGLFHGEATTHGDAATAFSRLVNECRKRSIPLVFWPFRGVLQAKPALTSSLSWTS